MVANRDADGTSPPIATSRLRVDASEIVAPHDFGFQLRHHVVPPELRQGPVLVDIVRSRSGPLVKTDVVSCGTVTEPSLEMTLSSQAALDPTDVDDIRRLQLRSGALSNPDEDRG